MQVRALPYLRFALSEMGSDNGATVNRDAFIPDKWLITARCANDELSRFTIGEIITLVTGSEDEQNVLKTRCPHADTLLLDAFDGDLSEQLFTPWGSTVDSADEMFFSILFWAVILLAIASLLGLLAGGYFLSPKEWSVL